jgi:hypothetical protein
MLASKGCVPTSQGGSITGLQLGDRGVAGARAQASTEGQPACAGHTQSQEVLQQLEEEGLIWSVRERAAVQQYAN